MPSKPAAEQPLLADSEDLRVRLAQAEATLREIRSGDVDALVIPQECGAQLFAPKDADHSFRMLVERMSEGALTMTAEGVIVYANRRLAAMLKTPLERVIGSTLRTWIAPGSQPSLQSLLPMGAGEEGRGEVVLATNDGTGLPVLLSAINLPIEGRPDAYCLVAVDLTEHKRNEAIAASERVARELLAAANQSRGELLRVIEDKTRAEEALRASQKLLKQTYDAMDQAIFVVNPANSTVVTCNAATTEVFGYQRDELIGRTAEFLHVDQATFDDFGRRLFSALETTGLFYTEFQMRRKNGEIFFTEITVTQIHDDAGRRTGVVSVVRDITERKRMEAALQESEAEFRILTEAMPQIVWITRPDGGNIYFNQQWMDYTGLTFEESLGDGWNKPFHPDDQQRAWDAWKRATETIGTYSIESRLRRADGVYRWWLVRGVPLRSAAGEVLKWFGTCTDIHDLKTAQEVARHVEQLQVAVMSTVQVATTLSEMRDPYTAGHERRVAEIAVAIGAELGLDERRQEGLRVAGHLHDVGKITIPSEILSKPGKISAVERLLIQGHAQAGYDVLKAVEFPWPVAQVALQHHERIDGSGYPQGLKGDAILFEARIMAVADVIEAMSSHRPYRPGLGIEAALAEIERGRGTSYDPVVVDACMKLFREKAYALPA